MPLMFRAGILALREIIADPNLGAKWAQNPAFLGANRRVKVSKGSRINADFAKYWSGRWESKITERTKERRYHPLFGSIGAFGVKRAFRVKITYRNTCHFLNIRVPALSQLDLEITHVSTVIFWGGRILQRHPE